jgi:FAD-dependent urate hydroxylase
MLTRTDVAIVGAGPYGLSVAAHLAARGVRFRIFGRAMSSWRSNMPEGMYLKSPGRASNLSDPAGEHTLEHYCKTIGREYSDWERPISGELFGRYGEWFQRSLIPDLDPRLVTSCEEAADGFRLQIDGGENLAAKSVVVSSGYISSARIPEQLACLPSALASHSSAHASFEPFRGKDVIVIGAGQSALETAALLREAGARPTLVARCNEILWGAPEGERSFLQKLRWPTTGLSAGWRFVFYEHPATPFHHLPPNMRKQQVETTLGPLGAWWLRDRVVGRIPLLLGWRLREARNECDGVTLRFENDAETMDLSAHHVIAATGYRIGPSSFPFLSLGLKHAIQWQFGSPVLSRHFESSVPGLHFTGISSAYSFGPVMRFVAGAPVTVRRLCGYLAARHRGTEAPAFGMALNPQKAA